MGKTDKDARCWHALQGSRRCWHCGKAENADGRAQCHREWLGLKPPAEAHWPPSPGRQQ